jgi:hypothetical protein
MRQLISRAEARELPEKLPISASKLMISSVTLEPNFVGNTAMEIQVAENTAFSTVELYQPLHIL